MISVKAMKKLAKQNIPMLLAIMRQMGQRSKKRTNKEFKKSTLCKMNAQRNTEGMKRKSMKMEAPKKNFESV